MILTLLGIASLFVCCMIHCKHLHLSGANKLTYLPTYVMHGSILLSRNSCESAGDGWAKLAGVGEKRLQLTVFGGIPLNLWTVARHLVSFHAAVQHQQLIATKLYAAVW